MTTKILYKYRFITESGGNTVFTSWLDDTQDSSDLISPDGSPINMDSVSIIETLDHLITQVEIVKEWVPTNGHFKSTTIDCIDVTPSGVFNSDFQVKIPISLMGGQVLYEDVISPFDVLEVWVGEKTWADVYADGPIGFTVGVLTEAVTSGSNTIKVSPTVIQNVNAGASLMLVNALDTNIKELLPLILSVNAAENELTLDINLTQNFSASTTYVLLVQKVVEHYALIGKGPVPLGYKIEKGSHIPAGSVIRLKYTNNHDIARSAAVLIEYLY
jgi:hypothetical protein